MQHGIEIELLWRDAEVLQLGVRAKSVSFDATVAVYTSASQVMEIADGLQGFPCSTSDIRKVLIGGFGPDIAGGAVDLRFFCADSSEHSFVETKMESAERLAGVVENCCLLVPIEAADIDRFVSELRRIPERPNGWEIGSARARAGLYPRFPSAEEMLREDRDR